MMCRVRVSVLDVSNIGVCRLLLFIIIYYNNRGYDIRKKIKTSRLSVDKRISG